MTAGCQRCSTNASRLAMTQDDIRRLARILARQWDPNPKHIEQLRAAKAELAGMKELIAAGHECDDRKVSTRVGKRNGALKPIMHGSPGGADTHRRRGEKPCADCLRAAREYAALRRAARRVAQ